MKRDVLKFYSQQGSMTEPGHCKALFDRLPKEPSALAAVIQGLALYDVVARDFYGVDVPNMRLAELHLRRIEQRIERLLELDPRSLEIARPPEHRVLGRCYQFALFLVSMLHAKGVPARARCGSAPTSTRQSSRTIGYANFGTRMRNAGFSLTRNLTKKGSSGLTSTTT